MTATSNFPFLLRAVDLIPASASAESAQNSEPSIGVNPIDPTQMWAASFGAPSPFFVSNDGGATWSIIGAFQHSDTSIAWKVDGSAVLVTTMGATPPDPGTGPNAAPIETFAGFGPPINIWFGAMQSINNDQPWIRTGPNNHVYVAFNNLDEIIGGPIGGNGGTASVLVSTDGGNNYTGVTLDRLGAPAGQDGPAVRLAVNGNTVYSAFIRWNSVVDSDANGFRFNAQVVVVRSDNGGADLFSAIGQGGDGVQVATTIDLYANTSNNPLTLGQNRSVGGNVAIAVDPNNSQHVLVVYHDAPGATRGQLQLVVSESTDGGGTWSEKFRTSSTIRSGQPAVAILANGAIGLLYNDYDPATDRLSQHLLTTTDDFATTRDVTLATASNAIPTSQFQPYLGDYVDLTGVGNTFYGVFSASNDDDGTNASFTNLTFNRLFTGTPGTSNFQLTDGKGNTVPFSIDPFFFSTTILLPPLPNTRDIFWSQASGANQVWALNQSEQIIGRPNLPTVPTSWNVAAVGDFNNDGISDLLWHDASGANQIWNMDITEQIGGGASLPTTPNSWSVAGLGNFVGNSLSDVVWHNASGQNLIWNVQNDSLVNGASLLTTPGAWSIGGVGNFRGNGLTDLIWHDTQTGQNVIWNLKGDAIVNGATLPTTPLSWTVAGIGAFGGNGQSDIIWHNANGQNLIWIIQNDQMVNGVNLPTTPTSWNVAGIGDFTGSGTDAILWHDASGANLIWNMQNNQMVGGVGLPAQPTSWNVSGVGVNSVTSGLSTGLDGDPAQLVQAMASFASSGANGSAGPIGQQPSSDLNSQLFAPNSLH
jgi:hypothetical protein